MSNICSKEKVLGPVSGVRVLTSNTSSFNTVLASCTTPPTQVELLRGVYLLGWMRTVFCLGMTLLMHVCEGTEVRLSCLSYHKVLLPSPSLQGRAASVETNKCKPNEELLDWLATDSNGCRLLPASPTPDTSLLS